MSLVEKCSSPLCSLNKRHEDWSEILPLRFLSIFFTRANCWIFSHWRMFPLFTKRMIKTFLNFKRCFSSILTDEEASSHANSFNMSSVTITLQNLFLNYSTKIYDFVPLSFFYSSYFKKKIDNDILLRCDSKKIIDSRDQKKNFFSCLFYVNNEHWFGQLFDSFCCFLCLFFGRKESASSALLPAK